MNCITLFIRFVTIIVIIELFLQSKCYIIKDSMEVIVSHISMRKISERKLFPDIWVSAFIFIIFIMLSGLTTELRADEIKTDTTDSGNVVENVKKYSKKDNFFSKFIKSILVVDDDAKILKSKESADNSIIKKFTGKKIRSINVELLDVFGGSVTKPDDTLRGWLENIGNNLHINTKEWLIKDMLIFSIGDTFTPFYILESERIIRQFAYIYDVRIIPKEIIGISDSIDIMVYVQDIWSMNAGVSLNLGRNTGSLLFSDLNFLGFGNEFRAGLKFGKQYMQDWDWEGSYSVNNIGNTFISAKMYYLSEINLQHYGLTLSRDFISPVINWGGGIAQHWEHTRYIDRLVPVKTARYNQQDYWLGYAFNIDEELEATEKQNRFNVAGRVTRTVFSLKPEFDSLNIFQNNTFYLARIGFSDRQYYKDQYVFGLGITEDVPLIKMLELLVGYENGENSDSPYLGIKSGLSYLTEEQGYMYAGIQIGSFINDSELWNFTSVIETMYFSKLNILGQWKWRHYISGRLSYIFNPIRPTYLMNINNEAGLRGFTDDNLRGNKKLIANYEADFFVPLKFVGFKLAIIGFADLGLISYNNSTLFSSKLYQGYGLGIRIKNEHLIFPTMQFMFGYYPYSGETSGGQFNAFYQSEIFYKFNQFQFSTPSIVTAE